MSIQTRRHRCTESRKKNITENIKPCWRSLANSLELYNGKVAKGTVKPTQAMNASSGRSIGVLRKKCRRLTAHQRTSRTHRMMKPLRSMKRRRLNGKEKM